MSRFESCSLMLAVSAFATAWGAMRFLCWKRKTLAYCEPETRPSLDEIGLKFVGESEYKGKKYQGGDKTSMGQDFASFYQSLLEPIRCKPGIQLLEIGVWYGKSLAMWAEYFKDAKGAMIQGVDICIDNYRNHLPTLKQMGAFPDDGPEIKIHEYNTFSQEFKKMCTDLLPEQDVIIDDGCHTVESQFSLFRVLFPRLKSGGLYIIEDIENVGPFFSTKYFGHVFGGVAGTALYFKTCAVKDSIESSIRDEENRVKAAYAKLVKDITTLQQRIEMADSNTNGVDKMKKGLGEREEQLRSAPQALGAKAKREMRDRLVANMDELQAFSTDIEEIIVRRNVVVFRKR